MDKIRSFSTNNIKFVSCLNIYKFKKFLHQVNSEQYNIINYISKKYTDNVLPNTKILDIALYKLKNKDIYKPGYNYLYNIFTKFIRDILDIISLYKDEIKYISLSLCDNQTILLSIITKTIITVLIQHNVLCNDIHNTVKLYNMIYKLIQKIYILSVDKNNDIAELLLVYIIKIFDDSTILKYNNILLRNNHNVSRFGKLCKSIWKKYINLYNISSTFILSSNDIYIIDNLKIKYDVDNAKDVYIIIFNIKELIEKDKYDPDDKLLFIYLHILGIYNKIESLIKLNKMKSIHYRSYIYILKLIMDILLTLIFSCKLKLSSELKDNITKFIQNDLLQHKKEINNIWKSDYNDDKIEQLKNRKIELNIISSKVLRLRFMSTNNKNYIYNKNTITDNLSNSQNYDTNKLTSISKEISISEDISIFEDISISEEISISNKVYKII